jgi:hypothetical protein
VHRIVRHARFTRELGKLLKDEPRPEQAAEGLASLEWAIARQPEMFGNAVHGQPGFLCRPFQTGTRAYLVLFTYDESTVTLVSVRRVPAGPY